jgi:hypothetical protein
MEQLIFYILIDNRGCHRKGIAMCNEAELNLQQIFGSIERKCTFPHYKRVKIRRRKEL